MKIAVVIETWNGTDALATLLESLASDVATLDAEVVITYTALPVQEQPRLEAVLGRRIVWCGLPEHAGYYDHKNRGFAASTAAIVAFVDGDCEPAPGWLCAITAPLRNGVAQVVAGATSYPAPLASVANPIDFPYFRAAPLGMCTIEDAPKTVLNFFANNVAFRRDVFAPRGYPSNARTGAMYHGQCQVLALQLWRDGIVVDFARDARVTHAWPESWRDFIKVRLLRGADAVSLLPHVAASRLPRSKTVARVLAPSLTLGLFAVRSARATRRALSRRGQKKQLRFVAASTLLDGIGALARPLVYRLAGVH